MAVRPLLERFMEKISPEPNSGCWLWLGCSNRHRYGQIGDGGKMKFAHRVSYEIHCGKIPEGMFVLHRCDNPPCVNPDHLFLGSIADNRADMVAKGRQPRREVLSHKGTDHAYAKLSNAQVMEIRSAKGTLRGLAGQYGVSHGQIRRIRAGEQWKHLFTPSGPFIGVDP